MEPAQPVSWNCENDALRDGLDPRTIMQNNAPGGTLKPEQSPRFFRHEPYPEVIDESVLRTTRLKAVRHDRYQQDTRQETKATPACQLKLDDGSQGKKPPTGRIPAARPWEKC